MGKFLGKTTLIKTHTQNVAIKLKVFWKYRGWWCAANKNVIYQNRSFTQKVCMMSILAKWVLRSE